MFSYDEFKAFVRKDGLSRQNRYEVTIPIPPALSGYALSDAATLGLMCQSVNVPGVSLSSRPYRYTGEVFEGPYDRNFGPAEFTFLADRKLNTKRHFDRWIETVMDPNTRVFGYYNDYTVDIGINVLDRNDKKTYRIKLFEAYPKAVGSLSLAHNNNDYMTFTVTMQYRYYQVIDLYETFDSRGDAVVLEDGSDVPTTQSSAGNYSVYSWNSYTSHEDRHRR